MRVQLYCFAYRYCFPSTIWRLSFPHPVNSLPLLKIICLWLYHPVHAWSHLKFIWPYMWGFIFGLSVLFYGSICLSLCHTFDYCNFVVHFVIRTLFFFNNFFWGGALFKVPWDPLWFLVWTFYFCKNRHWGFGKGCIALCSVATFTLGLSVYERGMPFCLLVLFNFFPQCYIVSFVQLSF